MTRKEHFSAAALAGLCANPEFADIGFDVLSGWAMDGAEELDQAFAVEDCAVEDETP